VKIRVSLFFKGVCWAISLAFDVYIYNSFSIFFNKLLLSQSMQNTNALTPLNG